LAPPSLFLLKQLSETQELKPSPPPLCVLFHVRATFAGKPEPFLLRFWQDVFPMGKGRFSLNPPPSPSVPNFFFFPSWEVIGVCGPPVVGNGLLFRLTQRDLFYPTIFLKSSHLRLPPFHFFVPPPKEEAPFTRPFTVPGLILSPEILDGLIFPFFI